jgi:hypothetical protein
MPIYIAKSQSANKLKKTGLSKNDPDKKFNKVELELGTCIEMEHTDDRAAAKEIAKDHLVEDSNYYKDKLFAKERILAKKKAVKKGYLKADELKKSMISLAVRCGKTYAQKIEQLKEAGLVKALKPSQKKAMKHSDKLGAGAKKRKSLKGKDKFEVVMAEFYRGTLHDSAGKIVTDKDQALAIAYSESGMSKSIKKVSPYEYLQKAKNPDVSDLEQMRKYLLFFLDKRYPDEKLEKARGYAVGTVRTWGGNKYKKTGTGKWARMYEGESRGKNISVGKMKDKIRNAKSYAELVQIVRENRTRFMTADGKPDPVVLEFVKLAQGKQSGAAGGKAPGKLVHKEYKYQIYDTGNGFEVWKGKVKHEKYSSLDDAKDTVRKYREADNPKRKK